MARLFQHTFLNEPFQRFLTWQTGKPRPGDEPTFLWSPWGRAAMAILTTLLGLLLSAAAFAFGGPAWGLLPLGWLVTTGGLRAMYLEIAHAAVHHVFSAKRRVNQFVTELFTTLTLTNHYREFYVDHVLFHHPHTGTILDVDYRTLLGWLFRPGMTVRALWRRLAVALVSPRVHGSYLLQRLRSNFGRFVPAPRRLAAGAWWGGQLLLVALTGAWTFWFLAWLVPVVWGYQVSSLLQMVGAEHLWGQELGQGKERVARLTYGRFLGDPYPVLVGESRARQVALVATWWARLLLLHLPARIAVYIGHDLGPAHDLHHRKPNSDWANAPYVRQSLQDQGSEGWPVPYVDHWGSLASHIARVFDGLSKLAPMTEAQEADFEAAGRRIAETHARRRANER